jgi:hypothetical protein
MLADATVRCHLRQLLLQNQELQLDEFKRLAFKGFSWAGAIPSVDKLLFRWWLRRGCPECAQVGANTSVTGMARRAP